MSSVNLTMIDTDGILLLLEELCEIPFTEAQKKVNEYVQLATGAKLAFLAPLLVESEEVVIHVVGEKVLDRELRFPVATNVLYSATTHRKSVTTMSVDLDEELLEHLQSVIDPMPETFLTVPVRHPKKQQTALVVCLVDYDKNEYSEYACTKIIQECFRFCLGYLLSSLRCYEEKRLKEQCQNLLAVSKKLLTHLGDLSDLLREIMTEVRILTNAERCSLFLLDPDQQGLVAKIFDGATANEEMRIPIGQGIAGHVAATGELLNIRNAYSHPLFYPGFDETTGFKTRNILCFPIRDEKGIVGVAQLCNKINGLYFDVFDEEIATAFGVYCGISIVHSIVYRKMQIAQARNKLSNEVMMYHMKVEEDAVLALLNCPDSHSIKDFNKFHFSPRSIPMEHMPCYTIKMFKDLDLVNKLAMKLPTLARFILYVKKGYRDAPYHNWFHAFSVAHFGYLLIKNLRLIVVKYMNHLQALAFLVACLCHDIDHRGTNNSFQLQCGTALASLYSSEGSVMERHHVAQTMCIINTEGCNIFECFTNSSEYSEALDLLRSNILATDLSSHVQSAQMQEIIIKSGFNKKDSKHLKHLFDMLMTCCDLSDQTKHWRVTKKTAELIYDEFFKQGDLERSMGKIPIEMMDREKASIPDLQVQFITNIVIPLFSNLTLLFPEMKPIVDVLKHNKALWEVARRLAKKYADMGIKGMNVLLNPDFEEEVLKTYAQNRNAYLGNETSQNTDRSCHRQSI